MNPSENIKRLYSIFPWPDNPFASEGRKRYESTLRILENIAGHEWVKSLLEKKTGITVKILDLCGAAGIGGVGLAKILKDKYGVE